MVEEILIQQLYSASLLRKEMYSIEDVLSKRVESYFKSKDSKVDFDGDLIKMNSQRYEVFDLKGIICCSCGLEGRFFAKERGNESYPYHFNLYAVNDKGEEVLMTKDHIVPVSKGGKNHISNYQTMCIICNEKKGNQEV
ncbi:HNH endonuclease [Bacillus phage G]|uniref:Gp157 n=1 Tax=Bacillus phage G TaxID=2884420 RepID=G3MBM3_9CAUD|nr:HNH endonuclease [Bacillus phage G]AEO93417.1 gp157 [Bacillus phage G]